MTKIPEPDQGHRTRSNIRYAAVAYDLTGRLIAAGEITDVTEDTDGNLTATITPTPEINASHAQDTP